jgi:hypothetical protein
MALSTVEHAERVARAEIFKFQSLRGLSPLVILLAVGVSACGEKPPQQAAAAAPPVTVAQPTKRTVTDWDEFTGRFEAVEEVQVRARVGGFVTSVEFRDGAHGLLVWALAVLIGAVIAIAASNTIGAGRSLDFKSSTAEPLFALELDQLFRSDRRPADPGDPELRAQAARIISSGLGHRNMALEDRSYLVRLVEMRTGLAAPDAENRVAQIMTKSREAAAKARRSAVIVAFMIGASLMLGAAAAWVAAAAGGQHRDGGVALNFWRSWEVDRRFIVRTAAPADRTTIP